MRTHKLAKAAACALVVAGLVGRGQPAQAQYACATQICDCATEICDPNGAPPPACEITGSVSPRKLPPGSTADCTGLDVVVKNFGKILVQDGGFTLKADSLTVIDGGIIEAQEVNGGNLGFSLDIAGQSDIWGSLQSDAPGGGGDIELDAGGDVHLYDAGAKGLEASGLGGGSPGGSIDVDSGGSIYISNPVRAEGGDNGEANGGKITMHAADDIIVATASGKLLADGRATDAGEIRLTAGGDITFDSASLLRSDGHGVGGNGGGISLTAGNLVSLGPVSARGGVASGGSEAVGGSLAIESGCGGVSVSNDVDLRGGEFGGGYDGGSLEITTKGDLTIANSVLVDTHGVGAGSSGGDMELEAGGKITLGAGAVLDAHGDTSDPDGEGVAGSVSLLACEVDVGSNVTINAAGIEGGAILLETSSPERDVTTIHVSANSSLDASGTVSWGEGRIHVAVVHQAIEGTCETDPNTPCTLDADCTVGCTTGNCVGLNPDTDDVLTQFLTAPDMEEDNNLAACTDLCGP